MIKEFLTDTLELDQYLEWNHAFKREIIVNRDLSDLAKRKSKHNFLGKVVRTERPESDFSPLDKIKIVVDSLVDDANVEKICKKERISKETYAKWKKDFIEAFNSYSEELVARKKVSTFNKDLILKDRSVEVYNFFEKHLSKSLDASLVIPESENLTSYSAFYSIKNVFVLNRMNNFRKINKHLEEVNRVLPNGGLLLGSFETFDNRAKNKFLSKIPVVSKIYDASEFLFKRVCPKLPVVKKLYFFVTKGKNRLLSKAEALGRLVSCGFEIVDVEKIDNIHYFAVKKVKEPSYDMSPSYGPFFKMQRVGKNGKIIGVYKFRTMHPYSEYLQDYILTQNGYSETGKLANDFRVVPWAKFLRRYWIDELPQLLNVLKGEMKLVGVRPVSRSYFDRSIPEDIQELRLTQKPGCIPPYVALDRKSSVDSVLQAEKEYLLEKIKNPYLTDTRFFFKALYNIVFKNKRSA